MNHTAMPRPRNPFKAVITDWSDISTLDDFLSEYPKCAKDVVFSTGWDKIEKELMRYFNLQRFSVADDLKLGKEDVAVTLEFTLDGDEVMDLKNDMDRNRLEFGDWYITNVEIRETLRPSGWDKLEDSTVPGDTYEVRFEIVVDDSSEYRSAQLKTQVAAALVKTVNNFEGAEDKLDAMAKSFNEIIKADLAKEDPRLADATVELFVESRFDHIALTGTVEFGDHVVDIEPSGLYVASSDLNNSVSEAMNDYNWAAWLMSDSSIFQNEDFTANFKLMDAVQIFENTENWDDGGVLKSIQKQLGEAA